jgi:hypothetical protein
LKAAKTEELDKKKVDPSETGIYFKLDIVVFTKKGILLAGKEWHSN